MIRAIDLTVDNCELWNIFLKQWNEFFIDFWNFKQTYAEIVIATGTAPSIDRYFNICFYFLKEYQFLFTYSWNFLSLEATNSALEPS